MSTEREPVDPVEDERYDSERAQEALTERFRKAYVERERLHREAEKASPEGGGLWVHEGESRADARWRARRARKPPEPNFEVVNGEPVYTDVAPRPATQQEIDGDDGEAIRYYGWDGFGDAFDSEPRRPRR